MWCQIERRFQRQRWRRRIFLQAGLAREPLHPVLRARRALGADGQHLAVDVDIDLGSGRRLTGTVSPVFGDRLVEVTYSKLGGKHLLAAWIPLLALAAHDPGQAWTAVCIGRRKKGDGARRETISSPAVPAVDLLRDLVAIYEGAPNAFATGAFKNSALVAVSTGLLQGMTRDEVEAVIGHEVAHIANGDMVTMTLIQGVMNTFVVFISRIVGYAVDSFLRRNDEESSGPGIGYFVTTIVMDIVLGFLAAIIVAWFSRQREFRADAGAAQLMGRKQPMVNALARLGGLQPGALPQSMAAMGIAGGIGKLFSTHPPIEERIAALQSA